MLWFHFLTAKKGTWVHEYDRGPLVSGDFGTWTYLLKLQTDLAAGYAIPSTPVVQVNLLSGDFWDLVNTPPPPFRSCT